MPERCECGGYIAKEIKIYKTLEAYLGSGWVHRLVYPTDPTTRMICLGCHTVFEHDFQI